MKVRRRIFYGWVIVAISLVIMTAVYGVYFSWPVFYVAILDDFGWSRAETALIYSAASLVYSFSSPISGILFDKIGPRRLFTLAAALLAVGAVGCSRANEIWQLCLFFGVFVGFGVSFAGFTPNLALVSRWFEKKRATALGISHMGTRDSFLLIPLIQVAILTLGWRYSYLVLAAGVAVIIMPLSLFLRARPQDMGLLPDGEATTQEEREREQSKRDARIVGREWASTEWTLFRAITKYRFWALLLLLFTVGFSVTSLINHLVALVTDVGFTAMFAANLLLVYAVTSMLGRCCGFISAKRLFMITSRRPVPLGISLVVSVCIILMQTIWPSVNIGVFVAQSAMALIIFGILALLFGLDPASRKMSLGKFGVRGINGR